MWNIAHVKLLLCGVRMGRSTHTKKKKLNNNKNSSFPKESVVTPQGIPPLRMEEEEEQTE